MFRRTVFGLVVLVVGLMYLLNQLGVVQVNLVWLSWSVLWPWLLVFVGLTGLKEFRRGRMPWGALFFIVFGVALSIRAAHLVPWLNHLGIGSLFWSLALIFFGSSLIFPKRWGRAWWPIVVIHTGEKKSRRINLDMDWNTDESLNESKASWNPNKTHKTKSAGRRAWKTDHRLIGDLSVGRQPWVLKNMDLWNGIGDVRVNLATAHVEDGSYEIEIRGLIGDVRVLVPENLAVLVDTEVGIGDVEVFSESQSGTRRSVSSEDPDYETAVRRCHITIALRIGDVEVVRV